MRVVDRYFFKEYLKLLVVTELASVSIYLLVDTLSRVGNFQGIQGGSMLALEYFIYKLPLMASQTLPLSSLLAALGVSGQLVRHNEILALETAGVSPRRLLIPFLMGGLLMTLVLFVLSEALIPISYGKAGLLKQELKVKKGKTMLKEGFVFKPSKDSFCFANLFDVRKAILYGVTLVKLDKDFNLKQRIDADRVLYTKKGWIANNAMRTAFEATALFGKKEILPKIALPIPFEPRELTDQSLEPEEMNVLRLKRYIQDQRQLGRDPASLEMDFHLRLALPLACPILILVAFPVATRSARPSFAGTLAFSLPLGFGYWLLTSFASSMGQAHILPMGLAAWISNLLFLGAGLALVLRRT